ncbi:MAG: phosphoribosylformylglycinamidine synthase subunit PurS [Bacteroidia bacterium]|jgi:phosphoribosylformylglycinamidine synthase|nr:phosphoribosylformylglycinamidine synthase subunit PurS [Bacteroidia bacterium]
MKFEAHINIMPHKALLDPQGKAVTGSMKNIGLPNVHDVRIGKHITMELEAANEQEASSMVEQACTKLLANLIMESFEFTIKQV